VVAVGGLCVAALGGPGGELAAQSARQPPTVVRDVVDAALDDAAKLRLPPRHSSESSASKSHAKTPTASLWGTVAALGVVLVVLVIAGRVLRKHGPVGMRSLPNEAVEPLGQRALARGVTVHLLRCGGRILVVGIGPDGARTLSEITDPVEVDLLTGACRPADAPRSSFAKAFRRTQSSSPTPTAFEPLASYTRPLATEVDGV